MAARIPRFVVILCTVCALTDGAVLAGPPAPSSQPAERAQPDREPQGFWVRMGALHHLEVGEILAHARDIESYVAGAPPQRTEDAEAHQRLLDDARGMLRYAERIAPGHVEVLEMRAIVEERAGRIDEARARYRALFERRDIHRWRFERQEIPAMPDRACVRYGLLEARFDEWARARAILRRCLEHHETLVNMKASLRLDAMATLANLYALDGRMVEGINMLERLVERRQNDALSTMVLLSLYDKDGRISQLLELLEQTSTAFGDHLFVTVARDITDLDLVPPEERHYMVALLLELSGSLPEAREEWLLYTRIGTHAGFIKRAREHVRDIDAILSRKHRR